ATWLDGLLWCHGRRGWRCCRRVPADVRIDSRGRLGTIRGRVRGRCGFCRSRALLLLDAFQLAGARLDLLICEECEELLLPPFAEPGEPTRDFVVLVIATDRLERR